MATARIGPAICHPKITQIDVPYESAVWTVTTPRSGLGREKARGALLETLERAAGHDGHRVAFRVFIDPDAPPVTVGGKGGYDPARALAACRAGLGDSFAWLVTQLADRIRPTPPAGAVTRVDVLSYPAPRPRCQRRVMSFSFGIGRTGMPARFPGRCEGCDDPIEVGQTIVSLGPGEWAHIDHRDAAERNADKPTVAPARFEDKCLGCGDPIEVGQEIAKVPLRGWAHAEHHDTAMRIYYPAPAFPSPEERTAVGAKSDEIELSGHQRRS